jgi:hypothetical protein
MFLELIDTDVNRVLAENTISYLRLGQYVRMFVLSTKEIYIPIIPESESDFSLGTASPLCSQRSQPWCRTCRKSFEKDSAMLTRALLVTSSRLWRTHCKCLTAKDLICKWPHIMIRGVLSVPASVRTLWRGNAVSSVKILKSATSSDDFSEWIPGRVNPHQNGEVGASSELTSKRTPFHGTGEQVSHIRLQNCGPWTASIEPNTLCRSSKWCIFKRIRRPFPFFWKQANSPWRILDERASS